MKKRMKLIAYVLGGMAVIIGLLWTIAAFRAGNFHTDRDVFVSTPDEPSMEEFSRRKKFINMTNAEAYDQWPSEPERDEGEICGIKILSHQSAV